MHALPYYLDLELSAEGSLHFLTIKFRQRGIVYAVYFFHPLSGLNDKKIGKSLLFR